ncbi:hypothetical protein GCM10027076_22880 [Nocardioides montaniterrae]
MPSTLSRDRVRRYVRSAGPSGHLVALAVGFVVGVAAARSAPLPAVKDAFGAAARSLRDP